MALSGTPGSEENRADPNGRTSDATSNAGAASGAADLVTRRSLRPAATRSAGRAKTAAVPPVTRGVSGPKTRGKRKSAFNITVMTIAAGLVATMALPAYAFNPQSADAAQSHASAGASLKKAHAQALNVAANVKVASVTRDKVTATSEAELAAQRARKRAAVQLASYARAYSGPSVADYLANPPYPNFSLAQVYAVATKYIGTPYVYGGATPAGFDCSGYVMFVYAQFGVAMPHSSTAQGNMGTRISIKDAVPGDLIVMPGHIGFYAGNGNILDAPDSGRSVSVRPIWTNNYFVVRIGI